MASGFYDHTSTYFSNPDFSDWGNDASGFDSSAYMFDSPQPESQTLPLSQDSTPAQNLTGSQRLAAPPGSSHDQRPSHGPVAQDTASQPSSASETSSHGSSSPSAAKRQASSNSPPPALFEGGQGVPQNPQVNAIKQEEGVSRMNSGDMMMSTEDPLFQGMDSNVNMEMDNLTLQSVSHTFDYGTGTIADALGSAGMFTDTGEDFPGSEFASLKAQNTFKSPTPKTVQPDKTFFLGGSREDSPNEPFAGDKDSPSMVLNHSSPLTGNPTAFGTGYGSDADSKLGFTQVSNIRASTLSNSVSPPSSEGSNVGKKWPCPLTIGSISGKSRVETQILIHMTLHNPPPGIKRIHIPGHTISKPKFQQKPPFEKSSDTLELSVLLVCASAMRDKEGAIERAFRRAEEDEIPAKREDPGQSQGQQQQDEEDPERPLNGGPVVICAGCIIRERKRAARKKTKKPEEEEEWLKDEAKRVIVFNCAEVKDWCLPEGTKEIPVKEHNGPLSAMSVSAPMRIACYCRHQQEKLGFQVIFTLRTSRGEIVAQAMSESIMITDDHKQPIPQPGAPAGLTYGPGMSLDASPAFYAGQQQYEMLEGQNVSHSDLPFRPSYSTPDLRMLQNQFGPQLGEIQRQFSSNNLTSQPGTASATPRNLSRPPSPTNPAGQPGAKKRRSGGSTNKIPSGLHMTSIESKRSPHHAPTPSTGLTSAPASTGFNFASPTTTSFGATPLDQSLATTSLQTPTNFASNPSTPLCQSHPRFANEIDPSQFYSAPTSQHASRAPSPTGTRVPYNASSCFMNPSSQSEAADALSALPPGLSLTRPPIIQRLIPSAGPCRGEDVTILGSGFCQGLEVMFGDQPSAHTTFWGDTTLVCRAPQSHATGRVPVCFKHQHRSSPQQIRELQNLMPTRPLVYTYLNESGIDGGMSSLSGMPAISGLQTYPGQVTPGGLGTPPTSGSVSPPTASGVDEMSVSGINPAAISQQRYMGFAGQNGSTFTGQTQPAGGGSAGLSGLANGGNGGPGFVQQHPGAGAAFSPATFARSQQEAAMAAGRGRIGTHRTVSGGAGIGR